MAERNRMRIEPLDLTVGGLTRDIPNAPLAEQAQPSGSNRLMRALDLLDRESGLHPDTRSQSLSESLRNMFMIPEGQTFGETARVSAGIPPLEAWQADLDRGLLDVISNPFEDSLVPSHHPHQEAPLQPVGDFINRLFHGAGYEGPQQQGGQGLHVGDGGSNLIEQALMDQGGGMGVGMMGGQGASNITEQLTAPLPPTGEEVFGGVPGMPTLGHDAVDNLTGEMANLRPEEFERRGINFADVFHGMGQGLMQAGRAPTMAEALLGAGTGAAAFQQQHEAEQDALERQRDEQIRQHQITEAETRFAGEQMLAEQEQQRWQQDLQTLQAKIEQDDRRLQERLRRTDLEVDNDGRVIIRQPGVNEAGEDTIDVTVITPAQQDAMLDYFGAQIAGEDFEFPDIGGKEFQLAWESATEDVRADMLTAAVFTLGAPGDRIPTEEGQQRLDNIRAFAQQKVEETQPGLRAHTSDFDDAVERRMFVEIQNQMARDPVFKFSLWAGSGNRVLRHLGALQLQRLGDDISVGAENAEQDSQQEEIADVTVGTLEPVRTPEGRM